MLTLALRHSVSALNAAISARDVQSLQLELAHKRCGFHFAGHVVARLATLAPCLGRESRILREAALLIRHTLAAFAARLRCKLAILGKAAFLARYGSAAHAGNLPLPLLLHRRESAIGCSPVLGPFLSHMVLLIVLHVALARWARQQIQLSDPLQQDLCRTARQTARVGK